ncbi:Eco57I restriction-modification methylase domain-containing protein [Cryptosporangium sp. NPDC051539]|uniref:Eco57I restriction-modification methylase domain-containing protein n=1 Tax=Cryptosporangium sp. NPDC051539 TaxID=3363962 RepID=UPI0037A00E6A
MNRRRSTAPRDLHRAWLELVDTDGPFLAVPALKRVWPQGMPAIGRPARDVLKDAKPAFEKAWEHWDKHRDDPTAADLYREARDGWIDIVLRRVLGWGDAYQAGSTTLQVRSPDHRVTVRPTGSLVRDGFTGALTLVVDPVDALRDPLGDGWATSPIDRIDELLRASGVPIGVVTDGRWWAIVSARPQTMTASGVVDAHTWVEEPQTRDAFVAMLAPRFLVGGKPEERLTESFAASVAADEEITEALGTQVRRAVELLVQALSEAALESQRLGQADPLPEDRRQVYEAAVTVMMRVVFLLFAEERGLLPQGQLFAMGYGVSDELDALDAREREEGTETLDGTHLTWHRLLATSQALYRGANFEDIRLPSYGGSLFDPTRFPELTATNERGTLAIAVTDRVMLEVLRAVQVAQLKGQPARRISFRDIDVEQIGYIYEGLLGYTSDVVDEVTVGLIGTAGAEPEISLATLEELAETTAFADALLRWIKTNQPAASPPTKAALMKAHAADVEDAERALRAITTDEGLRDRLRPFVGVIRRDLRNRPLVVQPGGVLVVETPSRASAGAHYTPRPLAEEVVRYALEPLVYEPGPHQTADRNAWELVPDYRILDLKVADIACGSGAFLVAAARYLAARLVEAWQHAGIATGTPHEVQTRAIRTVIARCLYGADINGMAVEMCKLSLWLVSLDPKLPFSFVDDKVLRGNSLIGLTSAEQLKTQHINPSQENPQLSMFRPDVDGVLARARALRGQLASEVNDGDPQRSAATKRRQWNDYRRLTESLTELGDSVVAAGLRVGGKPGKSLMVAYENLRIALESAYPVGGTAQPDRRQLDGILKAGLEPTAPTDYQRWEPLHWIVRVPDVIDHGGFDAIIGNPPFLGGQKLTGSMGTNVRDWLVNVLASGKKGSADLVGYFFLRAMRLLTQNGNLGLIATNTVAQGDTREVGLDQMVASGFTITRAVQSRSWPAASANLEYAAVWGTSGSVADNVPRISDDIAVEKISTLLEPAGRVEGAPLRLAENSRIAFIGCYVLGMGFVIEPEEAAEWIKADPCNSEVLFPYLNGEDLNSRPDNSASRWVIDFNDRPESIAERYALPYQRLKSDVLPERRTNKRKPRRERWWQFAERQPAMRSAIAGLDTILVIARVSKTVMPARVPRNSVVSDQVVIFATESSGDQAALSSSLHQMWAITYGSTLETRVRYTPSDVFETFPRPEPTAELEEIGEILDAERREIMLRRDLGLTKLYNLVNDPDIESHADSDVARVREIHVRLDEAVMEAYGWADVPLDHGFHTYRQMQRWTVSPAARVEILDRLLEENHRRAALQGEAPPAEDGNEDLEGDE